eukprot:394129-Hanusia_phi.AAC.2
MMSCLALTSYSLFSAATLFCRVICFPLLSLRLLCSLRLLLSRSIVSSLLVSPRVSVAFQRSRLPYGLSPRYPPGSLALAAHPCCRNP